MKGEEVEEGRERSTLFFRFSPWFLKLKSQEINSFVTVCIFALRFLSLWAVSASKGRLEGGKTMAVYVTLQIITLPQCYHRKMDLCLPLKWIFLLGAFLIVPQCHLAPPHTVKVLPSHLALF